MAEATSKQEAEILERIALENIHHWIKCICVIKFDLELGQTIEFTYPPVDFASEEELNISFLSFPDSNASLHGDALHSFRVKIRGPGQVPNKEGDEPFYFGYVFFRQIKDSTIQRGYFQKSVVVISQHPFTNVFKKMVAILGPMYFEYGIKILEAACHNIADWPDPMPGVTLDLPLIGSVLRARVPFCAESYPYYKVASSQGRLSPSPQKEGYHSDSDLSPRKTTLRDNIIHGGPSSVGRARSGIMLSAEPSGSGRSNVHLDDMLASLHQDRSGVYQEINLYTTFQSMIQNLWLMWELVLLGRPILVLSPSPTECSDAILGLVSLISPIPYFGDYRPYFTINDSDFEKRYARVRRDPEDVDLPSVMFGVTNPFFLKAMAWPTVVAVGPPPESKFGRTRSPNASGSEKRHKNERESLLVTYRESIICKYKPLLSTHKIVMKQLMPDAEGTPGSDHKASINNEVLRKHFLDLTCEFLKPFDKFFYIPMPKENHESVFQDIPKLPGFDEVAFLKELSSKKSVPDVFPVREVSKLVSLYRRFIHSPNFPRWYHWVCSRIVDKAYERYRQAQMDCDIECIVKEMRDLQIVDVFMSVKTLVDRERVKSDADYEYIKRMQVHMARVVERLPVDLQLSLVKLTPLRLDTTNMD